MIRNIIVPNSQWSYNPFSWGACSEYAFHESLVDTKLVALVKCLLQTKFFLSFKHVELPCLSLTRIPSFKRN